MKKFISILMICTVLILPVNADSATYHIVLNENEINFNTLPIMHNGSVYVSLREICDAYGAVVTWYKHNGALSIAYEGNQWMFFLDKTEVYLNGRLMNETVQAISEQGKVMIPVRFLSDIFSLEIAWQGSTNTVILSTVEQNSNEEIIAHGEIMGEAQATAKQLAEFLMENNNDPEIPCTAFELANIYLEEGKIEGVRGDIAFAQSLHETGFFEFGGLVKANQYNYGGLGATGLGNNGAKFKSVREGVRAQIQHLKAYASTEKLKQTCVDPRFSLVTRGSATQVEHLAQALNPKGVGWAYPGYNKNKFKNVTEAYKANQTYGQYVLTLLEKILN